MNSKANDAAGSHTAAGKHLTVAIGPQELCSVFGVDDPTIATRLLSQLVNVLHPDLSKPLDPTVISEVIGLVRGIGPTGAMEAMTAAMLVAAQHAALDAMRRASHPAQTPGGRQSYTALSLKAMRTFAQLLEAFNQGRGTGVARQEIIVQHVTVEAGAQAIVAPVTRGRG